MAAVDSANSCFKRCVHCNVATLPALEIAAALHTPLPAHPPPNTSPPAPSDSPDLNKTLWHHSESYMPDSGGRGGWQHAPVDDCSSKNRKFWIKNCLSNGYQGGGGGWEQWNYWPN